LFKNGQTNLLVTQIVFQPNAGWASERHIGFKLKRGLRRVEKVSWRVGVRLKEEKGGG